MAEAAPPRGHHDTRAGHEALAQARRGRRSAPAVVDVAIVGGGPAGSATALALAAHAPRLSIALIEADAYRGARLGETLPPVGLDLLRHLGVADRFRAAHPRPVFGTRALWGQAAGSDQDLLFSPGGPGWHLDRTAFDALLARTAAERGVGVLTQRRVCGLTRTARGWHLELARGPALRARFVVDASGQRALVARHCGARPRAEDALVGFVRFYRETTPTDPRVLVESFADGWWYTAGLPDRKRVVCCFTDADLARGLGLDEPRTFGRLLAQTGEIAGRLAGARPLGKLTARAVATRLTDPVAGEDWLAVGDAAAVVDPLSSQGIVKALRGGIFAAYSIAAALAGNPTGLARYRRFVASEHATYGVQRRLVYGLETRWPERVFWRRRQQPATVPDSLPA